MAMYDLLIGSFIGASAGSLATILLAHTLREIERDRVEVFLPIHRQVVQLSRLPHDSMTLVPTIGKFLGEEIDKMEEDGQLLPRRHRHLRSDLNRLRHLSKQIDGLAPKLRDDIQIEIHCELMELSKSCTGDGSRTEEIDRRLDDFLRSELLEGIYHADSHRLKTLPFRAARHQHYDGDRKALEKSVAATAATVQSTMAKDREEVLRALDTFFKQVERMRAGLGRVLGRKRHVSYRSSKM